MLSFSSFRWPSSFRQSWLREARLLDGVLVELLRFREFLRDVRVFPEQLLEGFRQLLALPRFLLQLGLELFPGEELRPALLLD